MQIILFCTECNKLQMIVGALNWTMNILIFVLQKIASEVSFTRPTNNQVKYLYFILHWMQQIAKWLLVH